MFFSKFLKFKKLYILYKLWSKKYTKYHSVNSGEELKINLHGSVKEGCNFPIIEFDKFKLANNAFSITKTKKKKKIVRKDFHEYLLVEVKSWLLTILPDFLESGVRIVDIIHGYRHGTTIRDYVRSDFKGEFQSHFPLYSVNVLPVESGRTLLYISLKVN